MGSYLQCRQGREFWLMHLPFVHCVILSRLPEEQVSELYDFVCGNSFTSLFMKFLALKIFLCFINKKIVHFIFHLQFFKCWMLINSNVVVPISLWTNSKFYCVRDHGSMFHQCLLWRHWDCNSDSTERYCTHHWS